MTYLASKFFFFLSSKAIKSNTQNLCISPLNDTMRTIKDKYTSCKVNELWNIFKVDLIKSIETNIPHKMITYKHRLPWVTNNVRKLINKKNKAYNKRKTIQRNIRHSNTRFKKNYEKHIIEQIICDIPIGGPDQHIPSNVKPKKLFNYVKSIRTDGILVTGTVEKADILNNQFQSVFTNETDRYPRQRSRSSL